MRSNEFPSLNGEIEPTYPKKFRNTEKLPVISPTGFIYEVPYRPHNPWSYTGENSEKAGAVRILIDDNKKLIPGGVVYHDPRKSHLGHRRDMSIAEYHAS